MCTPRHFKIEVHEEVRDELNFLIDGLYDELRHFTGMVSDLERLLDAILEINKDRY